MKQLLIILGIVFLAIIILLAVGIGIVAVKGSALDKQSKAYVDIADALSGVSVFGAMILFGLAFPELTKPYPWAFFLWPVATTMAGIIQRHKRWKEMQRRVTWHSRCDGIPRISSFFRWPRWALLESRLVRWVEPFLFCVFGGLVGIFVSHALGLYLMVVSACMAVAQQCLYEQWINQLLDALDNLIESNAMSQLLEVFNPKNAGSLPPTVMDLEGAYPSTPITATLIEIIEMKRAKQGSGPDNLYR